MGSTEKYSADERRFALLTALSLRPHTAEQIFALPAFNREGISEAAAEKELVRDIEVLRSSGHRITNTGAPDYQYVLDNSGNIPVDGTGMDLSLVRYLLKYRSADGLGAFAQQGVTKLLSSGEYSDDISPYTLHVPTGEAVTDIAPAIQLGKRIQFDYSSASTSKPARYLVEPWQIQVHFGAFYLLGHLVARNGDPTENGTRTFKLDRVCSPVTVLDEDCVHPVTDAQIELAPVNARVFLTDPTLPLAQRGRVLAQRDGGVEIELIGMERTDLFDDLIFHGTAAQLLGPDELREEYVSRLRHLVHLNPRREKHFADNSERPEAT
ncbi:MAG: WYL domain-containing protein [Actinomycetaceae bacterium]|nr:WYL domain-containing protein [Actinomycetaceae bacterium]